jgi:dethiobiotin synthetase
MSYFVTGTDTGVGKTLIGCALLEAFAAQGLRVVGMKPVAAGCDVRGENEDVQMLSAHGNVRGSREHVNPFCFPDAIAPHIAARKAGAHIDVGCIVGSYRQLAATADVVIVEGVGGYCVPLNNEQDTADLAAALGLPVIMVVGLRLGCLNHALLTLSAIARSGLECAGWVANVLDAQMPALQENIDALRQRIAAPLLGIVPYRAEPDARAIGQLLDITLLRK